MYVPVGSGLSGLPLWPASSRLDLEQSVDYRPLRWARRSRGLGSAQQIGQAAASGAAITGSMLTLFAGPGLALAGPIGAAVAGLTQVAFLIAGAFKGCGDTCVEATRIADQVQVYLTQNLDAYMASPRYRSLQVAALQNVDNAIASMRAACGNPVLGAAGQRCISERLIRGAPAPWCPAPGGVGCDWITVYRDPISTDAAVLPDPNPVAGLLSSAGTVSGIPVADLLLPAGLVLAGLFL